MKKLNSVDALHLSKEIIASLSEEQLQEIEGGGVDTTRYSCLYASCNVGNTEVETEVAN